LLFQDLLTMARYGSVVFLVVIGVLVCSFYYFMYDPTVKRKADKKSLEVNNNNINNKNNNNKRLLTRKQFDAQQMNQVGSQNRNSKDIMAQRLSHDSALVTQGTNKENKTKAPSFLRQLFGNKPVTTQPFVSKSTTTQTSRSAVGQGTVRADNKSNTLVSDGMKMSTKVKGQKNENTNSSLTFQKNTARNLQPQPGVQGTMKDKTMDFQRGQQGTIGQQVVQSVQNQQQMQGKTVNLQSGLQGKTVNLQSGLQGRVDQKSLNPVQNQPVPLQEKPINAQDGQQGRVGLQNANTMQNQQQGGAFNSLLKQRVVVGQPVSSLQGKSVNLQLGQIGMKSPQNANSVQNQQLSSPQRQNTSPQLGQKGLGLTGNTQQSNSRNSNSQQQTFRDGKQQRQNLQDPMKL